jgi:hypothetical protein
VETEITLTDVVRQTFILQLAKETFFNCENAEKVERFALE